MHRLKIDNRSARRLLLQSTGLSAPPTGPLDIQSIIQKLGFVQLDTIRVVARAHDHILWSRNQNYRERHLEAFLAADRLGFEHFTHDASVLPMEFFPMWQRQFDRLERKVRKMGWHKSLDGRKTREAMRERISNEGPLDATAFGTKGQADKKTWGLAPHKQLLDYMWYAGELTTAHRSNFRKFYDLTERVIPESVRETQLSDEDQIDWLCQAAVERLGFGSPGEIQRFWDAVDSTEVKRWLKQNESRLVAVSVEDAEGNRTEGYAPADIDARLESLPSLSRRIRVINPFDPLTRDRVRLKRLFGFDYRVEMFVPREKRVWGYYVFPLLEGDRFVGRLEAKADRKAGRLTVSRLWPEQKAKWGANRHARLEAELDRLARFIGVDEVIRQDM